MDFDDTLMCSVGLATRLGLLRNGRPGSTPAGGQRTLYPNLIIYRA